MDPSPGAANNHRIRYIKSGQSGAEFVWGHFVDNVVPSPFTAPVGPDVRATRASFQPCIAVLVE